MEERVELHFPDEMAPSLRLVDGDVRPDDIMQDKDVPLEATAQRVGPKGAKGAAVPPSGRDSDTLKQLRVLSYNVLAFGRSIGGNFPYSSRRALNSLVRRAKLASEMEKLRPDVCCLQDVDNWRWWQRTLRVQGLEGTFVRREKAGYREGVDSERGVAILWRRDWFRVGRGVRVSLDDLVLPALSRANDRSRAPSGEVALFVTLLPTAEAPIRSPLHVGAVELTERVGKEGRLVREWQALAVARALEAWVADQPGPIVMGMSAHATPESRVYHTLRLGTLPDGPRRPTAPLPPAATALSACAARVSWPLMSQAAGGDAPVQRFVLECQLLELPHGAKLPALGSAARTIRGRARVATHVGWRAAATVAATHDGIGFRIVPPTYSNATNGKDVDFATLFRSYPPLQPSTASATDGRHEDEDVFMGLLGGDDDDMLYGGGRGGGGGGGVIERNHQKISQIFLDNQKQGSVVASDDSGMPTFPSEKVFRRKVARTAASAVRARTCTIVIRDLAPGATYRFRVRAVNAIGRSAPSPPSAGVRMPASVVEAAAVAAREKDEAAFLDGVLPRAAADDAADAAFVDDELAFSGDGASRDRTMADEMYGIAQYRGRKRLPKIAASIAHVGGGNPDEEYDDAETRSAASAIANAPVPGAAASHMGRPLAIPQLWVDPMPRGPRARAADPRDAVDGAVQRTRPQPGGTLRHTLLEDGNGGLSPRREDGSSMPHLPPSLPLPPHTLPSVDGGESDKLAEQGVSTANSSIAEPSELQSLHEENSERLDWNAFADEEDQYQDADAVAPDPDHPSSSTKSKSLAPIAEDAILESEHEASIRLADEHEEEQGALVQHSHTLDAEDNDTTPDTTHNADQPEDIVDELSKEDSELLHSLPIANLPEPRRSEAASSSQNTESNDEPSLGALVEHTSAMDDDNEEAFRNEDQLDDDEEEEVDELLQKGESLPWMRVSVRDESKSANRSTAGDEGAVVVLGPGLTRGAVVHRLGLASAYERYQDLVHVKMGLRPRRDSQQHGRGLSTPQDDRLMSPRPKSMGGQRGFETPQRRGGQTWNEIERSLQVHEVTTTETKVEDGAGVSARPKTEDVEGQSVGGKREEYLLASLREPPRAGVTPASGLPRGLVQARRIPTDVLELMAAADTKLRERIGVDKRWYASRPLGMGEPPLTAWMPEAVMGAGGVDCVPVWDWLEWEAHLDLGGADDEAVAAVDRGFTAPSNPPKPASNSLVPVTSRHPSTPIYVRDSAPGSPAQSSPSPASPLQSTPHDESAPLPMVPRQSLSLMPLLQPASWHQRGHSRGYGGMNQATRPFSPRGDVAEYAIANPLQEEDRAAATVDYLWYTEAYLRPRSLLSIPHIPRGMDDEGHPQGAPTFEDFPRPRQDSEASDIPIHADGEDPDGSTPLWIQDVIGPDGVVRTSTAGPRPPTGKSTSQNAGLRLDQWWAAKDDHNPTAQEPPQADGIPPGLAPSARPAGRPSEAWPSHHVALLAVFDILPGVSPVDAPLRYRHEWRARPTAPIAGLKLLERRRRAKEAIQTKTNASSRPQSAGKTKPNPPPSLLPKQI